MKRQVHVEVRHFRLSVLSSFVQILENQDQNVSKIPLYQKIPQHHIPFEKRAKERFVNFALTSKKYR